MRTKNNNERDWTTRTINRPSYYLASGIAYLLFAYTSLALIIATLLSTAKPVLPQPIQVALIVVVTLGALTLPLAVGAIMLSEFVLKPRQIKRPVIWHD